jgi:TPR repeat protein
VRASAWILRACQRIRVVRGSAKADSRLGRQRICALGAHQNVAKCVKMWQNVAKRGKMCQNEYVIVTSQH